MDDLISDALQKNLITFEQTGRACKLAMILSHTKDMTKLPELDLGIYWTNYIAQRDDHAGFNDKEN
jgi:hypothetical protein